MLDPEIAQMLKAMQDNAEPPLFEETTTGPARLAEARGACRLGVLALVSFHQPGVAMAAAQRLVQDGRASLEPGHVARLGQGRGDTGHHEGER